MAAASEAAQRAMEDKMGTTAYRNEFIESFVEQGHAQGIVRAKRDDILKVMQLRGIGLSDARYLEVETCLDVEQLQVWFDRAATATTANDIFRD
jgi:hypothetical protein